MCVCVVRYGSVYVHVGVCGGQKRALYPMELSYSCEPHDNLVLGTELGTYCKSSRHSELLSHLSHLAVFETVLPCSPFGIGLSIFLPQSLECYHHSQLQRWVLRLRMRVLLFKAQPIF